MVLEASSSRDEYQAGGTSGKDVKRREEIVSVVSREDGENEAG